MKICISTSLLGGLYPKAVGGQARLKLLSLERRRLGPVGGSRGGSSCGIHEITGQVIQVGPERSIGRVIEKRRNCHQANLQALCLCAGYFLVRARRETERNDVALLFPVTANRCLELVYFLAAYRVNLLDLKRREVKERVAVRLYCGQPAPPEGQ